MVQLKVICFCLLLLTLCDGATVHDGTAHGEKFSDTPDDVKTAVRDILERLDRWDSFYMGRLEPRMIGAATSLANLDSNIRNLQERAHVWDTFQLHVSAWNDQIKALDHKVNIINEGYEKLLALDSKLFSALNVNNTLNSLLAKLNELDSKLENVAQSQNKDLQPPLVNEFAGRGVLHTIKLLEKKLDRLQVGVDRIYRMGLTRDVESMEDLTTNKMTIKCTTPPNLEESLQEISRKIDNFLEQRLSGDASVEIETDSVEIRHLGKTCKRLVAPYKRLLNGVEYLKGTLHDLVAEEPPTGEKSLGLRKARRLQGLGEIHETLEDIERSINNLGRAQDRNINENERILRRIERKVGKIDEDDDLDEVISKKLNRVERYLKLIIARQNRDNDDTNEDDDDDDDDNDDDDNDDKKRKRKRVKSKDTDEDDDDDDDNSRSKKGRRKNDDTDEDDDDDDDNDDDDDEDDDDDNNDRRRNKQSRKNKRKDNDDSDDDDDDDGGKSKRKGRKNDDDDDDDDDDNDSDNNNDDDDDDDDDDNSNGRRSRLTADTVRFHKRNIKEGEQQSTTASEQKSVSDAVLSFFSIKPAEQVE